MSETAEKLMSNYAASYIQIALTMREPLFQMKNEIDMLKNGLADTAKTTDSVLVAAKKTAVAVKTGEYTAEVDRVVNELSQCVAIMPWDWRPRILRAEIQLAHGRSDEAMLQIETALKVEPGNKEYLKMQARLFDLRGEKAQANRILQDLVDEETDPWAVYSYMCKNYEDLGLYDSAMYMMQQFRNLHPGDQRAAAALGRFEHLKAEAEKKKSDTAAKPETGTAAVPN
jgi:predicted Zn-dependent protease